MYRLQHGFAGYYFSLTKHSTLWNVLKSTYFMTVVMIDGEFCLRMGVLHVSVVTLEWNERQLELGDKS